MSEADDIAFREMFPLVIGALAALAVVFLVVALIVGRSVDATYVPPGMTKEDAIAQRVAPVGEVNTGGPEVAQASATSASGDEQAGDAEGLAGAEQVYEAVCSACHARGVAGAPRTGTAAWEERLRSGSLDELYGNAINGLNAMPPKGGDPSLSDDQVRAAVDYILEESGLSP